MEGNITTIIIKEEALWRNKTRLIHLTQEMRLFKIKEVMIVVKDQVVVEQSDQEQEKMGMLDIINTV